MECCVIGFGLISIQEAYLNDQIQLTIEIYSEWIYGQILPHFRILVRFGRNALYQLELSLLLFEYIL
jgi:hypothetical protein